MAFRRSDLQEAFFVPGTYAFRVWGYGTTDPLEEVLAPDYFKVAGGLLRPGELIYVSATPEPVRAGGPERGKVRLALVMVRGSERGAASAARLVQDFGSPDDPPGTPALMASDRRGGAASAGQARPGGARPAAATRDLHRSEMGADRSEFPASARPPAEILAIFIPPHMLTTMNPQACARSLARSM